MPSVVLRGAGPLARVTAARDQTKPPSPADVDSVLMLRVRDGDREAFRELYEKHAPSLIRYAAGFVGSAARAEEMAQEIFLQVYRARRRYEPKARFTTWLFTIAHNLCLNEVRRFEYRGKIEGIDPDPDEERPGRELEDQRIPGGEAAASSAEFASALRSLMAELPESQRTALLLSRLEGLRYEEIGEVLGCSEQAVKSLIFRATQRLKEGLKEWIRDDP